MKRSVFLALLAMASWPLCHAFGGGPVKMVPQYVHDHWAKDQGFVGGAVYATAQSQDGYMWFGTEQGLVRFDGLEFTLMQPFLPGDISGAARGLLTDHDGNLWIRFDGAHLLRYRNGVFDDAVIKFGLREAAFTAMALDNRGELLLGGARYHVLRFHNGKFSRFVTPEDRHILLALLAPSDGMLWMGTRDAGLFGIKDGKTLHITPDPTNVSVNALAVSSQGGIWIGGDTGLWRWENGVLKRKLFPGGDSKVQVLALADDRSNNLWIGTDRGLYLIDPEGNISTEFLRNAGNTQVTSIYEDRENEIWLSGSNGVERLREGMFSAFPVSQSRLRENGGPIFADEAGRTWFAPVSGGLYVLQSGTISHVNVDGLGSDVIYSISGGSGEVWLGRQRGGLTQLTLKNGAWISHTYIQRDGLAQNSVYTVHRNRDGSVWAGTISGGISVFDHGRFTNYTVKNGLDSNAIFSSTEAADGTMWFASPSGLVSFVHGRWTTYGSSDPLPPNVRTVFEDAGHMLWVGTSHGLAHFDHGQIVGPGTLPRVLHEEVVGITQDANKFLWVVTLDHVLQIPTQSLLNGTLDEHDIVSYGLGDGLTETEGVRRDRSVVADTSGRIWISLAHSIAVANPATAVGYTMPASVIIESVASGRVGAMGSEPLKLPAGTQSVTLRYASSNMSEPGRFRYRLTGMDTAWSNEVSLREVVYTNLGPGDYVFHIMASDGLGRWNGPETAFPFRIEPAFWQTYYFRAFAIVVFALVIVLIYRIRMAKLTEQLNIRFQDRLAERTRIAQDLHDTLLQGVMSASMQLDIAHDRLPEESVAKPMLARVLQLMRQVSEEGRQALRGLRSSGVPLNLEAALRRLRDELAPGLGIELQVVIQGESRPIRPVVGDEIYRIAREAISNAFVHAHPTRVTVSLDYSGRAFRLMVSDNGCGMDAGVIDAGREGHWGLAGMRERAKTIASIVRIRSRIGVGTEIELIVPAAAAFTDMRDPWRRSYLRKLRMTRLKHIEKEGPNAS